METYEYRVDPRMAPPVVISMALAAWLVFLEGSSERGFFMILILLPFFYLGAEVLARKVIITSQGITIRKLLRSVHMDWTEISTLDYVRSRNKLFLILQTVDGKPSLITNTISPFHDLAKKLLELVPPDKITEGTREALNNPPAKNWPLIQAWIICVVLIALMIGRFFGLG
jgi:hypothetical protein|uniref:PH domain-containing protein n=1 Tax=Desulfomonile tiedjei TaxID=2358 RepID=A0A7C4EYM7_9BACT